MGKTHENYTVSMQKTTMVMLYELSRRRGKSFNISKFINNATRDALLRALAAEGDGE